MHASVKAFGCLPMTHSLTHSRNKVHDFNQLTNTQAHNTYTHQQVKDEEDVTEGEGEENNETAAEANDRFNQAAAPPPTAPIAAAAQPTAAKGSSPLGSAQIGSAQAGSAQKGSVNVQQMGSAQKGNAQKGSAGSAEMSGGGSGVKSVSGVMRVGSSTGGYPGSVGNGARAPGLRKSGIQVCLSCVCT